MILFRTPAPRPGASLLAGLGFIALFAGMAAVLAALAAPSALAQSRIKTLPGYDQYARIEPQLADAFASGAVTPEWDSNGRAFEFEGGGKRYRFDAVRLRLRELRRLPDRADEEDEGAKPKFVLARGRGAEVDILSPDGATRAFTRDMNVWIRPAEGGPEINLSRDGGPEARIRHGVGSYLYLEEFAMRAPVWWSPDGRRLAWMRFDERPVPDYFLSLDQTRPISTVHTQAYPHPGEANPIADVLVHDFDTGRTITLDVREGAAFTDSVVGHYVWNGQWTADGSLFLVFRSDRLQKVQDLAACDPVSGGCRSVVREERPQSWAQISPPTFLKDGRRFIWASERTGYRNLYLYDLSGALITPLTRHGFEAGDPVHVDERAGRLWYMARSGDNYMKEQLHRVGLDGRGDRRVSDPAFTHRIQFSPDGRRYLDTSETHDQPPTTSLHDDDGKRLAEIAVSDIGKYRELGIPPAELFTYTAADGVTELHGLLFKPSGFDPSRRYPVLFSVYGAPGTNGASERFQRPIALAEFGFLIVRLDARTAGDKGRAALDRVYQQVGPVEVDDFAAAARALSQRPYVDAARIGIYGTSYGGTTSALALLNHPDVFAAAASSSAVTDFRLYDTAYSERLLGLPAEAPEAYDRIAYLDRAADLKGDLLLYYGTADDNVHPKNTLIFIERLQEAGKSFEVQVGPDRGHTSVNPIRMMEFFIDSLVLGQGPF
ncbi:prolyl oligopeptidase family serine peptidase [bacterium]|nr:prolyl oligopeptidase family serine peptidase [bacterium]